jgi:hypothetical protein
MTLEANVGSDPAATRSWISTGSDARVGSRLELVAQRRRLAQVLTWPVYKRSCEC